MGNSAEVPYNILCKFACVTGVRRTNQPLSSSFSLHQKLHLGIVKYLLLGERRWVLLAVHMVCFMLECAFGPLYVISGASLIAQMVVLRQPNS